jgi:hypothetical protein
VIETERDGVEKVREKKRESERVTGESVCVCERERDTGESERERDWRK